MTRPDAIYKYVVLGLLWLAGFYMRVPILAAAPLGPEINADFGLTQTALGALTTLPVLMLGLGALPASMLIGRIGARNTVVLALLVTAIASGLRGAAPNIALLLACTAVMGLGIAAMQPSLPALVPRWCPGFVALGSSVYLNGMMISEFAGAGLTLPLVLPLAGGSWRMAFVLWSVPGVIVALALFYPKLHGSSQPIGASRSLPAIKDSRVWAFGLMLGVTSATFFGVNAYMASVLDEKGLAESLDVALLLFNLSQVVASVIMLAVAHRILALPRLLFATVSLIALGLLGFMLLSGMASIAATLVLGFASALQLIALVMLPPLLRSPDEAGKLAAGMFAIGYILGFLIPLGAGVIADLFASTRTALWLLVAFNLVCLPLAWQTPTEPGRARARQDA